MIHPPYMKIAVASGKGGTGKSTFAANLALSLSKSNDVVLVDCDVEEPNLHLFFDAEHEESEVTVPVPVVDPGKCTFCGKCGDFCQYGAITVLKDDILILMDLCHSCGGCRIVCPYDAITEVPRVIGKVRDSQPDEHLRLVTGVLNEGETHAPVVIQMAKALAGSTPTPAGAVFEHQFRELVCSMADVTIYDSSPGIACPVIETVEGADYVVLVTESTPFGIHDLELAIGVVEKLGIPAGVVINRSDGLDEMTEELCRRHSLEIIMRIPFDRRIAGVQNRGGLFSQDMPEWQGRFTDLYHHIRETGGGGA